MDGFLFAGNRHEAVPRALFTDSRLTPLERNTWQVLRILLDDDGVTSMPTYEQLRPYLATVPCGGVASDETIARALTLLRLTRWLILIQRQRHESNGRLQGNLYVLHDAPLTPGEIIELDPDYLSLVSRSLTHASKAVQRVGRWTLREVVDDPLLVGRVVPTRLQVIAGQLASESWAQSISPAHEEPSSESEDGYSAEKSRLRNPKAVSTVRSSHVLSTSSSESDLRDVPRARAREVPKLRYPQPFDLLNPEQQSGALAALRRVPPDLQQAVLDDWSMRCRESKSVRNPAGYLFGIIQAALRGDFNVFAGRRRPSRRS